MLEETLKQDWEVVKEDGTIKRFSIPGGWIYSVWTPEMIRCKATGQMIQSRVSPHIINAFFVSRVEPL